MDYVKVFNWKMIVGLLVAFYLGYQVGKQKKSESDLMIKPSGKSEKKSGSALKSEPESEKKPESEKVKES